MTNRLASETSLYLRQHAEDPVDWWPWSPEAIEESIASDRPIFLSIGYASCHWCHVMQRESFRDPETAAYLNEHFVPIKVDRETRPDIDEFAMAYIMGATGRGGWPTSLFLTPDLTPYFGGTYFPPTRSGAMPSFMEVLDRAATYVTAEPAEFAETVERSREFVSAAFAPLTPAEPSLRVLERAAEAVIDASDPAFGGFGHGAPKFPQAPVADFLLAFSRLTGDERAQGTVEAQLEGMLRGGIYDHVGGGIARYSTDERWVVPHFEKMLYDNAQLLTTLAMAHELEPRVEWERAIRETVDFLDRELTSPHGGYASSLSADTGGVEGATYVWSWSELYDSLTPEELSLAEKHLGVTRQGNFDDNTNVLVRIEGREASEAEAVDALLAKLRGMREERPQPELDDKAITSWNALAARGLMDAGRALGDNVIQERGMCLVRTILAAAVAEDGTVRRLLGDAGSAVLLEDAGGVAAALVQALEVTGDAQYSAHARRVIARARELYEWPSEPGVLYLTPAPGALAETDASAALAGVAADDLPVRVREQHDSPAPTGASLLALAAVRLGAREGDEDLLRWANAALSRWTRTAQQAPAAAGTALQAMVELIGAR